MANKEPLLNNFELNEIPVLKILKYFEDRLATLRIENDNFDAEPAIRGRIAEIKTFQRMCKEKLAEKTTKHVRTM